MAVEPQQLSIQFVDEVYDDKIDSQELNDIVVNKIGREIDQRIEELENTLHSRKNDLQTIHHKMEMTMMKEDEFLLFGKKEGALDLFPTERCDFSLSNIKRIEAPILMDIEKLTKEIDKLKRDREKLINKQIEIINSQKSLFDFD